MNAHEWGLKHKSCKEGLEARRPYASQHDWYKACSRGDWLLWQLSKITLAKRTKQALKQATSAIADRAVRNHALKCGIADVEQWARDWLSGKDRSHEAAAYAAENAEWLAADAAAYAAENAEWLAADAAAYAAENAACSAADAAAYAAENAAWSAAYAEHQSARTSEDAENTALAAELKLQADDIHRFIPEWPGVD